MLAGGDLWMMVLDEAPNLAQCCQIVDLNFRLLSQCYAGTCVELLVSFDNHLFDLHPGRLLDGSAIHQQLQIVHPHSSRTAEDRAEKELPGLRNNRQLD